jgi:hypothetical protein
LGTITACLMVETDDKQWGRQTRDHRNRESGKKSRRPYAPCRQRRIEVGVGEPTTKSRMHPSWSHEKKPTLLTLLHCLNPSP